jgi:dTDP-4-amino-4,6-dideoxygalactose transaminase
VSEIPLVDLKAQYAAIRPAVDAAIARVLRHAGFILGAEVSAFEDAFAAYVGARGAVGVASGTAALQLSLVACGIGPGDEVVLPSHTFMATAEAVSHAGATPVFADIDPASFTLDPGRVEAALGPRTKALIPVHIYGRPATMGPLLDLAKRRGLRVIEDAAQAHGAELEGRRCGAIGDLGCFSFFPAKNLGAYGDAGAVTGNDRALLDRVRKLRDHGRRSKYEHDEVGFAERMDALQAAILGAKLPYLEAWTEARRRLARRYAELLAGLPLGLPSEPAGGRHAFHLYVVRTARRDALLEHLKARGIGAGVHYPVPLHRQPAYARSAVGPSLPETERAAAEVLSVPLYPEMTEVQQRAVADAVRSFFA